MEIRNLMGKIVRILDKTYYGDVRFELGQSTGIGKNKSEENINTASSVGLCIRVFSGNKWHYLGFNEIDEEKIINATKRLVTKVGDKKSKLFLQDPWEVDKEIKVKQKPEDVSLEEKMQTVREVFKKTMDNKKIVNALIVISHSRNETIFMNTEGSVLRQVLPYFRFSVVAMAKEGKRVEQDYSVLLRQGGYELLKSLS